MAKEDEDFGISAKKVGKIALGIIIMLLGLVLIWFYWKEFLQVIQGVAGIMTILTGAIILALGATD